jgi:hypothetical protein
MRHKTEKLKIKILRRFEMNARNLRAVGIIVLLIVLAAAAAQAGKDKCGKLPDAVKAVINAEYPGAEIEEVKAEKECIKVYEVELEMGEEEVELEISADGKIIEKETELSLSEVPAGVKAAIEGACEGGEIEEVTKEVTYWVVTLKKLETPKTTYEAEVVKDGKEIEIEVAADGTVIEQKDEDEDEHKHKHKHKDKAECEDEHKHKHKDKDECEDD